jgi:long-subunit fatty acid transport protein
MKLSDVPSTYIPDASKNSIVAGLVSFGLTTDQINAMDIKTIQATYAAATPGLQTKATQLNVTALTLAGTATKLADKKVDTKQTGAGFTPIIGIDIHLEKLNIALKYEHQTTLKLTNATVVDGTGLFNDGEESRSDMPAIISGGADYKVTDKLKVSGSFNSYLDKNVNWGGNVYKEVRTIDKNYLELAFGVEYKLTNNFALSAGYMNSNTGVSKQYQSDFSFSNDSYTTGLGFQWNMNKKLVLDAGMMLTTYKEDTKTFTDYTPNYTETYGKDTFTLAFGIGYKIF